MCPYVRHKGPVRALSPFVVLGLLFSALPAAAVDLKVTDSRGTEVVVADAGVDCGGSLGSETVTDGIRIQRATAEAGSHVPPYG